MKSLSIAIAIAVMFFSACLIAGCRQRVTMWEVKCAACHDGQTVLNGKVVPGKEDLKAKYANIREFMDSCEGAPSCMNILKHDPALFLMVGREIGIPGMP